MSDPHRRLVLRSASLALLALWCGDPAAWRFVLGRYLPVLAVLNLLWEIAQLPLYTLWTEAISIYIAYAVLHCTIGDVLIGSIGLSPQLQWIVVPITALVISRRTYAAWPTGKVAKSVHGEQDDNASDPP